MAGGSLAGTLVHLGRLDEAETLLAPLDEEAQAPTSLASVLRSGRGLLRTAQHRTEEALEDFYSVGDTFAAIGIECPGMLPWRSEAAWAHMQIGQREEAERLARSELTRARAFEAPRALGLAAHATGVAVGGDEGEALIREAVGCLTKAGVGVERARAQTDLGALLRRGNRRAEAREYLREALDTASRAGARAVADQAEIELRATGAKPRRVVLTGLEALTASERRVAELAAQGLTNRDIAQQLFVTARTVEGHLTNVFRKLDIESRDSLAEALAGPLREPA
jgi:DNA-binding CsgD family transcriptional regulator